MAQVTRENIHSQFRGARLTVFSPEHDEALVGRFIRTNVVVNDNQEFLYVTIETAVDGPKVFDIDRAIVFNDDKETE